MDGRRYSINISQPYVYLEPNESIDFIVFSHATSLHPHNQTLTHPQIKSIYSPSNYLQKCTSPLSPSQPSQSSNPFSQPSKPRQPTNQKHQQHQQHRLLPTNANAKPPSATSTAAKTSKAATATATRCSRPKTIRNSGASVRLLRMLLSLRGLRRLVVSFAFFFLFFHGMF